MIAATRLSLLDIVEILTSSPNARRRASWWAQHCRSWHAGQGYKVRVRKHRCWREGRRVWQIVVTRVED